MIRITATLALCAFFSTALAEKEPDSRIRLLLTTIETPDTRTDKFQDPPMPPLSKPPYTEADLAKKSGEALKTAQAANEIVNLKNHAIKSQFIMEMYQRRVEKQDEIVAKQKGTTVGRNLLLMRDWMGSAISKYSDHFLFISRTDGEVSEREGFYSGADPTAVEDSNLFIKLIVNDPKETTKSIITPGGNELTKKIVSQLITVNVQDMKNALVFAKDVEISDSSGSSSVVAESGDSDAYGKVARKCLAAVADAVAEHFLVNLTVKVKPEQKDDDFDTDDVSLTISGMDASVDEGVRVARKKHKIVVECDGYETIEKEFDFSSSKGDIVKTIRLAKVTDKKNSGTSDE